MSKIRRCKHRSKGIDFCLNHCPYAEESDCIDGKPVVEEISTEEQAKAIINQKYEHNIDRRSRNREYKKKNRDKIYFWNKEYAKRHPDVKQKIARKYARIKSIQNGTAKIMGTALINGKETIIYGTKYNHKYNYWFVWGEKYHEIDEDEVAWLWIEKRCV